MKPYLFFISFVFGVNLIISDSLSAQTIEAQQEAEIVIDSSDPNKANPGETIRYRVTIINTDNSDGTGVQLILSPDPRTTFLTGSFKSSPLALPDMYDAIGNVGLEVAAGAGLLSNDFDDDPSVLTITEETKSTNEGGMVVIREDGSFEYEPAAGFIGEDTFTYELNDGTPVDGTTNSDIGTVTVMVSNIVWFVDNTNSGSGGTGTLSDPFQSLGGFNGSSLPAENQLVFILHTGIDYSGGLMLQNGQTVFGSGHGGGDNLAEILPFSVPDHTVSLPSVSGTPPVLTNVSGDCVTLAAGNTLRGFDVGGCSGFGMNNSETNSVGDLVVNEVSINNTTGGGFRAGNGSGAAMNVLFSSISSTNGGVNGIRLNQVAGSFIVTGATNITGTTGTGISITDVTTSLTVDFNGTVVIDNATSTGGGVDLVGNTAGTFSFNGGLIVGTTSSSGFNATSGGTITVAGTNSTVTTTTSTAVNIEDTTIGAAGVTFQSVSTNGAVNSIVLSNTGSNGAFTVTGTGISTQSGVRGTIAASLGSGGTIQNTTGTAIMISNIGGGVNLSSMTIGDATATADQTKDQVNNTSGDGITIVNADNIVLENMKIARTGGHGITGDGVTNFTLANSEILNAGDGNDENGLNFADGANNLDGTALILDSILSASAESNAVFSNDSGMLDLAIENSHFTQTANTGTMINGEDGLVIENRTSGSGSEITATIANCQFDLLESDGLWVGVNAGTIILAANGNSFTGFDTGTSFSDNAISLNSTGDGTVVKARIEDNEFVSSYHSTIILNFNSELDGGGNPIPDISTEADVIIANNDFTGSQLGAHIEGGADDNSTVRVRIEDNEMVGQRLAGILLSSNNISTLHSTILDNTIGPATGDNDLPFQENLGVTVNDSEANAFLQIENNTVGASRNTAAFGQPEAIGIINSVSSANVGIEHGLSSSNDPAVVILDNNLSLATGDSNGTGVDIFGPVTVVNPGAVQQPTVP